jgi:hypothetical protein
MQFSDSLRMHNRPALILPDNDLAITAWHIGNKWEQVIFIDLTFFDGIIALCQNHAFGLQIFQRMFECA